MSRPRFREREVVSAAELTAERDYLVDLARRHRVAGHSWGIVVGLALSPQAGGVLVQPGVAVDGFGRELVVAAPVALPVDALEQLEADAVAVWLLYGRVADTPPQRGRWPCGPGRHSRWREEPCLRMTADDDEELDPRRPPGVGDDALLFGPQDDPPDASAPTWPVFLGRLVRDGAGGFVVDAARRSYAGLVGERIAHPTGSDALRIGGDQRGFALQQRDAAGAAGEPLTVDADGDTTLAVDTEVCGDVVLADPGSGGNGLGFTPLPAPPAAAAPWRAYRTTATTGARTVNQLRLEIEHPGEKGDPQAHALSIGYVDDAGTFVRRLTITSECVVSVFGEVHVEGLLTPGPIGVDADDPRFREALLDRWLRGIADASHQLGEAFGGDLAIDDPALTPHDATGTVDCDLRVENTGTAALPVVTVTATVKRNGTTVVTDAPVGTLALDTGGSDSLQTTLGPMGPGTIKVEVTARATAPAGYELTATADATTTLQIVVN